MLPLLYLKEELNEFAKKVGSCLKIAGSPPTGDSVIFTVKTSHVCG